VTDLDNETSRLLATDANLEERKRHTGLTIVPITRLVQVSRREARLLNGLLLLVIASLILVAIIGWWAAVQTSHDAHSASVTVQKLSREVSTLRVLIGEIAQHLGIPTTP
jgi:hypothetical protein